MSERQREGEQDIGRESSRVIFREKQIETHISGMYTIYVHDVCTSYLPTYILSVQSNIITYYITFTITFSREL